MRNKFLIAAFFTGIVLNAQTQSQTINYSGTITTFTVPSCVTSMTIEARGAQGGYNTSSGIMSGNGAVMIGTFAVTPGQVLKVLVGEQPSAGSGNGGGGGTFVTDAADNPLIIAGGGGGSAGTTDSPDKHGNITTTGGTGAAGGGTGGSAGNGGGIGPSGFQSGAGGGLLTNGADGWTVNTGGAAFINGGAGGPANSNARGGFGGGGSGSSYVVGGGGGGYSGGGSGGNQSAGVGGGGGSYNGGTNQTNTGGANTGHGLVIFTWTTGPSSAPNITALTSICSADTLTLSSNIFAGAITYNWSLPVGATILTGAGTDVITVAHTTSGVMTATLTVTDACGTIPAGTFTYTVNATPSAVITVPSTTVCEGSVVALDASASVGASTYSWSSGGTDVTDTVLVNVASSYTLTASSNGCSDTGTITINTNPNPAVVLGADTTVCSALTLDAGNAGSSYMWSDSSTSQTLVVSNGGTYNVSVTDINGCVGVDTITVAVGGNFTVTASAALTFVCTGEPTINLTGTPAGGSWAGAGIFGSAFEPDTAGAGTHSLVYTYTDAFGCSGADSVSITVDLCTGIDYANTDVMNVYPNPNNGQFNIVFAADASDVIVEITDVEGRTVQTQQLNSVVAGANNAVSMENAANGFYFVKVTANGVSTVQRISVVR